MVQSLRLKKKNYKNPPQKLVANIWAPKSLQMLTTAMKLKTNKQILVPWKKSYDKPRQCIEKQRHYFAKKDLYSQSYGFSSSRVQNVRVGP